MKITEELLKHVVTETLKRTGHITEAFAMQKDFKKGMRVSWNTLEKIIKVKPGGKQKVDYERVSHEGEITDDCSFVADRASCEPGYMVIMGEDGNSYTVAISELTPV
tara:strand:+ start:1035 stop:1355 length:321 start_codon:yes stop_codon:yes gene_type:complete